MDGGSDGSGSGGAGAAAAAADVHAVTLCLLVFHVCHEA